ncbi:hypothetical protein J2X43_003111 [Rhizobium sp. BE258]|nr:hypothetical protein [Rhizobium sp. BE258]
MITLSAIFAILMLVSTGCYLAILPIDSEER